ncbi:MAG TPA: phage/plasmid primase, P4 family [Pyrinomonadaceae bacterium]|jgi:putative DNA primase/helicase
MSLTAAPESGNINLSEIAGDIQDNAKQLVNGTSDAVSAKIRHKDVLQEILNELESLNKSSPIDFRALAGVEGDEKLPQKHLIVLCVQELLRIIREKNFDLARKHDFIFAFNGEFWSELDRETIKNFLGAAAKNLGVKDLEAHHYEFRDKLYKQFLSAAHFEPVEADNRTVLINLQNGTFKITKETQRLCKFAASDFLTYQLPFKYDETAAAPLFRRYLNRTLPEKELQDILAEFVGYVFTKYLKLERALLLFGTGANGKSVLFDILNALLGKTNITNFSLSDLLQEHNRALIANKLLNYGSEINAGTTRDIFKNLVSCEPIMARLKYGNSFLMTDYAKLCFNCNELPRDIEQTNAYFRRLLIIPFRVTIPEAEQDKTLASKIIESELSGVFNWILEGLRRLLKNERFTESEIIKAEVENYRKESDSAAMFIEETHFQKVSDKERATFLKVIYSEYKLFCQDYGFRPLNIQNLCNRLKASGFECPRTNKGILVYAAKP